MPKLAVMASMKPFSPSISTRYTYHIFMLGAVNTVITSTKPLNNSKMCLIHEIISFSNVIKLFYFLKLIKLYMFDR